MIYSVEYTVKIKLDKLFMPPGHSPEELEEEIKIRGRENLKRYFNDALFDPNSKITLEKINSELLKP